MAFKRFLLAPALMLSLSASSGNVPYEPGVIRFAPIALDRDRPERRDFDELTLLGAWSLTSDNPDFGGISAIQVKDDRITAINDDGKMFRFPLADSSPNTRLQSRLLPALKRVIDLHADSESLAIDPDTGMVWVGFEATNTIQRFTPDMRGRTRWTAPRQMTGWPKNAGAEALVRMRDGRFLVFSERSAGPRGTERSSSPAIPRCHANPRSASTTRRRAVIFRPTRPNCPTGGSWCSIAEFPSSIRSARRW